jgi:proteasome lid subunit RPN8/RPN11
MAAFDSVSIPAALLEELIAHAVAEFPLECCGLLAGNICDGIANVTTRFAIANELRSETAYRTEPRGMLAAFRAMRESGTELLAIYHSHPTTEPVPSARDLADNTYGESVIHVIVGRVTAEPVVRMWWLSEREFREVAFQTS